MPPSLCEVTGTLYDATGAALAGVLLTLVRVVKDGVVVSTETRQFPTDEEGVVTFSVLRASRAFIHAPAVGWDDTGGLEVEIPDASTADLEDLPPATEPLPSNAATQAALAEEIARAEAAETNLQAQINGIVVGSTAWGTITGNLSDQLDLLLALAPYTDTVAVDTALDLGDSRRALILVDTSAADVTVTLPPAGEMPGREVTLKKIADDNLAILDADALETIDGQLVFNLELLNQTVTVIAVGDAWYIV